MSKIMIIKAVIIVIITVFFFSCKNHNKSWEFIESKNFSNLIYDTLNRKMLFLGFTHDYINKVYYLNKKVYVKNLITQKVTDSVYIEFNFYTDDYHYSIVNLSDIILELLAIKRIDLKPYSIYKIDLSNGMPIDTNYFDESFNEYYGNDTVKCSASASPSCYFLYNDKFFVKTLCTTSVGTYPKYLERNSYAIFTLINDTFKFSKTFGKVILLQPERFYDMPPILSFHREEKLIISSVYLSNRIYEYDLNGNLTRDIKIKLPGYNINKYMIYSRKGGCGTGTEIMSYLLDSTFYFDRAFYLSEYNIYMISVKNPYFRKSGNVSLLFFDKDGNIKLEIGNIPAEHPLVTFDFKNRIALHYIKAENLNESQRLLIYNVIDLKPIFNQRFKKPWWRFW